MQKSITPKKMQQWDREAREKYGIPSLILMENAGRSAADVAASMLSGKKKRVVCVCGHGNNGGDGFVCSRHLRNKGFPVEVFVLGAKGRMSPETLLNLNIIKRLGCPVRWIKGVRAIAGLRRRLRGCGLVVDAVFGIGFKGSPRSPYKEAIEAMNVSGEAIVSLDVPSGLDAQNGLIAGACVRARATVTFGFAKTGLFRGDGLRQTGRLIVADISLPGRRCQLV